MTILAAGGDPADAARIERRALGLLMAAFALAWTLAPLVARWGAPIWDDTMEAWTWGQVMSLGYYKLPPFYAWVAGTWYRLLPRTDLTGYLLPALNAALMLPAVWCIARRFVATQDRMIPTLLATTLPTATYMATVFNANTVLLPLWSWMALALIRVLERRRLADAAALGALAASAMLSKYSSALMLASCLAASVLHPDRRAFWRSPAPYVAGLVAAALFAPHVWWLVAHDYPTFRYAASKVTDSRSVAAYKAVTVTLTGVALTVPMLLALWLGLRNDFAVAMRDAWRRLAGPDGRWFLVLTAGPFVLTILSGLLGGIKLAPNYLIPTLFLLPVALVAGLDESRGIALRPMIERAAIAYSAIAVVLAPAVGYASVWADLPKLSDPVKAAVEEAQELWRQRTSQPVRIVAGSELYALALHYYLDDRPLHFAHFNLQQAPWISPELIRRDGLLAVCVKGDAQCKRLAGYLTPAAERYERTLERAEFGVRGVPTTIEIVVIPPGRAADRACHSWRYC